jgi:hypothetical protein
MFKIYHGKYGNIIYYKKHDQQQMSGTIHCIILSSFEFCKIWSVPFLHFELKSLNNISIM